MLLDTAGLLCLHHRAELQHSEAVRLVSAAGRMLVHSYVLAEFVPLCSKHRLPRAGVLAFLNRLGANPAVDMVFVDQTLHDDAMHLLSRRLDKDWSLCDAVSFLLMQSRGIYHALTTDHHFEQAGFVRLLKP